MLDAIRTAKGLAERVEARIASCGGRVHAELQRLCHLGRERPTVGQWRAGYARFSSLINPYTPCSRVAFAFRVFPGERCGRPGMIEPERIAHHTVILLHAIHLRDDPLAPMDIHHHHW